MKKEAKKNSDYKGKFRWSPEMQNAFKVSELNTIGDKLRGRRYHENFEITVEEARKVLKEIELTEAKRLIAETEKREEALRESPKSAKLFSELNKVVRNYRQENDDARYEAEKRKVLLKEMLGCWPEDRARVLKQLVADVEFIGDENPDYMIFDL